MKGIEMNKYYVPNATKIYHDQEKNLKIDQVKDLQAIGKKSRAMKLKFNPRVKKLQKIGGIQVWLVDGVVIRKHFDVDFVFGGHGYRYLYVPINEIWIDNGVDQKDIYPTVLHEFTERHLMERGWGYNDGHDYAARMEIGLRRGTEFVLPVSNFKQRTNYSCGAVAMRIIFEYFGHEFTEKEMIKMVEATPEKGTDMKDMVSLAKSEHFDFKVQWKQKWTVEQVKKSLEAGFPIVVNFQMAPKLGEGHYAVIIGYTKDEFIFSDPSGKEDFRKEKIEHFMKRWYELEDKTEREGMVIYR